MEIRIWPGLDFPTQRALKKVTTCNKKRTTAFLLLFILAAIAQVSSAQSPMSYDVQGPLSEPRIFAEGIISTGDYDTHPAFSPDSQTLFFVKMAPDLTKWTIFVSHYKDGQWTEPEIASFSGQYWDADPYFSKDGNTLFFISNRPLNEGQPQKNDFDIWKVEKQENGWSNPIRLESPLNSQASEYYPTITDVGTMYFGSRREGGKGRSDIYVSRLENGKYRTAENLGESVNTAGNEFEPFIAFDESFLIFMATPSESLEEADLYISYNQHGKWTSVLKLPAPFNSEATEFSPKVTRDLKYFFFSSTRNKHAGTFDHPETTREMNQRMRESGNGLCDIYQVDFAALQTALKK
jgi:WD40-like Beta Propeller Repeat